MEINRDLWRVEDGGSGMSIVTNRVGVGQWTIASTKLHKALGALEPEEIAKVLSGSVEENVCTCTTSDNQARCQHNFTYTQVCKIRGDWFSSTTPEHDVAQTLRTMNELLKPGAPQVSPRPKRTQYYLLNRPVCRGFFTKCLGLDHRVVNAISSLVQGKEPVSSVRSQLPSYEAKTQKYDLCCAFWTNFFGDQCQTSDMKHRYFPVNLSMFYIYNNPFWA